jgi:hypothetical protein
MSKIRHPLGSDGAKGKMDEENIFSHRHGITYRKRFAKPKQPNTKAQKESRKAFTGALRAWQRDLNDEDRAAWRAFARKHKEIDPFTLTPLRPPAHSLYIRFASQAKRVGNPALKRPPQGPRPIPVQLTLKPKGKGVKISWKSEKEGVLELRMAVTQTWVNPWQSLYRVLDYVPMKIGEHYLAPLEPGKKYTFLARVLTPDGQASLATLRDIVL